MRRFPGLFLFFLFSLFLWNCGGGGGGSSSVPAVIYSGQLSQATISADNAMNFVSFVLGEGIVSLPPTEETIGPFNAAVFLSDVSVPFRHIASSLNSIPVSGSFPGLVSGVVSYSGTVYSDGTANITFTYVNFNDGDGYTYDGKVAIEVLNFDFDLEIILSAIFSTDKLVIQWEDEQMTLTGNASIETDPLANREIGTMNFDGRDDNTQETFRLENLQSAVTCDNILFPTYCSEVTGGGIYLETEGYVEITQDSPLIYNYYNRFNENVPDSGGPLRLLGAGNTEIVVTPFSISQVRVDVDTDGDGVYEYSDVYLWTELTDIAFTFENTLGTGNFEVANDGRETSDGGYVAVGWTNTMAGNGLDAYLVKVNAAGEPEWVAMYGGAGDQEAWSVIQTLDGGFAMIGTSTTTDIPSVEHIYVVKTDADGNEEWSLSYSGDISSNGYSVHENTDGSLIIAGNMYSWGPFSGQVGLGFEDVYLAKLSSDGQLIWEKRLGGPANDYAYSLLQTDDSGYVLAGTSESFDSSTNHEEVYLVKTDSSGNVLWERHFGGAGDTVRASAQFGYGAVADTDGNLIVVGSTTTFSYGNVLYLVKTDANGSLLWERVFAEEISLPPLRAIDLTESGNYVLAGNDLFDVRLLEIDISGILVWDKSFNWSPFLVRCTANSVQTTMDGGYAVFGSAWPSSGKDFYVVKTNDAGVIW